MENNNNLTFVAIITYGNAEKEKKRILKGNKGKAGIYMWTHLESGRVYIGSANEIADRLKNYFYKSYLEGANNYISRALLLHGYSAFSLSILEYIDITGLSKEKAQELIKSREQSYLDQIFSINDPNTYNLNPKASSRLGAKHSEETLAKMREREHSEETKALIAKAHKGNKHSEETKALIAKARKGTKHSEESIAKMSAAKAGENNPKGMLGKYHSAEARSLIAETKRGALNPMSKKVFVYDNGTPPILCQEFLTCTDAAKHFNCCTHTITKYLNKKKFYKKQWILSSSLISNG